jgi:hypothetical protein
MNQSLLNKTLLALAVAGSLAAPARAQNSTPLGQLTGTGVVAYESQYVYRGKKITNSSIQPTAEIGLTPSGAPNMNIYVGAWSNQPISRRTGAGLGGAGPSQSDEIDVWGGVHYDLPALSDSLKFSADVGDIYYWYPESGGVTPSINRFGSHFSYSDEIYAGLTWQTPAIGGSSFNPAVYYYHDLILNADTVEVSVSTTIDLSRLLGPNGFSLKPSIVGGWTASSKAFGDQLPGGVPNWRNSYKYWKAGIELDYNLSPLSYLFGELDYAGNDDGKTGGPAAIGGNPQLGGTSNSVWFGAGLKFRK